MSITDIARTDVTTASTDTSVENLARTMRDDGVGSVVVVEDDEPVGIVTDRDLSVRLLAEVNGVEIASKMLIGDVPTSDVMTHKPYVADVDDDVLDVLEEMCAGEFRRAPITDDGELHGIVTLDDIVARLATELFDVAWVITEESPPVEEPATAD